MAEIYIINSKTPKDLALELQQIDKKHKYTLLNSKTASALLLELEEAEALKDKNVRDWREFLFNKTFEPNKLSNKQIEDLCYEFHEEFVTSNRRYLKHYPKQPKVEIIEKKISWWYPKNNSRSYRQIVNNYLKSIDAEINTERIRIWWQSDLPLIDPVSIRSPYCYLVNRDYKFGGIVQYKHENYRIYDINFEGRKLSAENQKFWSWYQKTFDVIAMYHDRDENTCYVIKKPDEWVIEDNNTKMHYRYGDNEKYFFGRIEVPKWLYVTPADEINPRDYLVLDNADQKTEFIKKIGIDKLVEFGTVIDSYENYPDNEMWVKSEYKIIDMSTLCIPKVTTHLGRILEFRKYAPYLYMKNQTTGVYHLEGIHPRCKTLYDAIKMRYNGLNISDFEIKDIK